MLKVIIRHQSTAIQHHFSVDYKIKDFSDFPIKYHKNFPDIKHINVPPHLYDPNVTSGFIAAYDRFLTLFSEERYTELYDIAEHNFVTKLKDT